MQVGECLGDRGEPAQNCCWRQSGSAIQGKDLAEVDAFNPIHHQDVVIPLEKVVAGEREARMGMKRQQRPRLGQQTVRLPRLRRDSPHLERHVTPVTAVHGANQRALAPTTNGGDHLVAAVEQRL